MKFLMAVLLCVGFSNPANASTSVDPVTALVSSGMFGVGAAAEIHARRVLENLVGDQIAMSQAWSRYRLVEAEQIRRIRKALSLAGAKQADELIGSTSHTTFEEAYEKALKFAKECLPSECRQKATLTSDLAKIKTTMAETYHQSQIERFSSMSKVAAKYNRNGVKGVGRVGFALDVNSPKFGRTESQAKPPSRLVVGKGPALVRNALMLGGALGLYHSLETDKNDAYRGTPQYYDTNVEPIDEDSVGSFGE